jgi:WD40 repeat protein
MKILPSIHYGRACGLAFTVLASVSMVEPPGVITTGDAPHRVPGPGQAMAASLDWTSIDGKDFLAIGYEPGVVAIWSISDDEPPELQRRFPAPAGPWGLRFSPDGSRLLIAGVGAGAGATVRSWQLADAEPDTLTEKPVFGAAWSPDGRYIALVQEFEEGDFQVSVRLASGPEVVTLATRGTDVDWHPTGRLLAMGSRLGEVEIWDTTTWEKRRVFEPTAFPRETSRVPVRWSLSGDSLAWYNRIDGICISDKKGALRYAATAVDHAYITIYSQFHWAPHRDVLAYCSDRAGIVVVDPASGRSRTLPDTHGSRLLRWSPGGRWLAVVTDEDESVRFLNVERLSVPDNR